MTIAIPRERGSREREGARGKSLVSSSGWAGALMVAAGGSILCPAARAASIKTVFVISMENHNWIQPDHNVGGLSSIQQVKGNPNAPFINSLVSGTATSVNVGGTPTNISAQTAYTDTYYHVLYHPVGGSGASVHPSEPNYIWAEGGTNYGVANDNQPYGSGGNNQNTTDHLSTLLSSRGNTWKSYQEDIDTDSAGNVLAKSQWISPIVNRSGTYSTVINAYNGSKQFDYAAKHNPMVFFTDTNGGNNATSTNPAAKFYAPIQQLTTDLAANAVAQYNWITPNQFNDMHTVLTGGYKPLNDSTGLHDLATITGDSANIRQGDDFLKQMIPKIMASQAYQNNGAIIIWNDETEAQGGESTANSNATDHSIMEIVISPLAHANVGGLPFDSLLPYTHSSDVLTMQAIFQAPSASTVSGALGDAATPGTNNLSALFAAGTIPTSVPEPVSAAVVVLSATGLTLRRRRMG